MHSTAQRPDLGFDFGVTSLRMFSVYGPGQSFSNPYQGVLGIFSGNLLRGEPITIFGDGDQTRDFVYIDDIVEGWVRALETPASRGQIINLGSGRSLSINELAQAVIAAFGQQAGGHRIVRAASRPGEQRSVRADIGLAKSFSTGNRARRSRRDWPRPCAGPGTNSPLPAPPHRGGRPR